MGLTRTYKIGDDVAPLSKTMTQEAINLFEKSGGKTGPSQFTDEATARETLGTRGTVASGRMSLTFASEMLRRYFGADIYNRRGTVDLRFLRPLRPGDTITFTGKVTAIAREPNGGRVTVELTATNQKGDVTAAGSGGCIVFTGSIPAEE
jgi:3-hydroxybutyryl-CoA dehydratase